MIVTRQRRKPFPWRRLLKLAIVAAVIAAVLWWPVSRNWLAGTPPMKAIAASPIAAPFNAMALQRQTAAQAVALQNAQTQVSALQSALDASNRRIAALQRRLAQTRHAAHRVAPELAASTAPSAAPTATPQADLAGAATPQDRRTAADWSAMDATAAAKIVQRLPMDEVKRVFAVMSPDAVGPILEALPPAYAAKLTQEQK